MKQDSASLPLDALERAAKAMLEAVQMMRAVSSPGATYPHSAAGADCRPSAPDSTLLDLANEFLIAKARAGRSDNYLKCLRAQLHALTTGFPDCPPANVRAADLERWLYAQGWSPRTIKGHLMTARTLFGFAVARAYVVSNPALAVDLPTLENEPPFIHTPEAVARVLDANLATDPSACRCLAVRYFAGLRTSEAVALDEAEILESGFIEVTAAKSKTRRRRLVTVQPALAAWLRATGNRGGVLPLKQSNNRLCDAVKRAEVPWEKSVTRHSFCSYHLAKFKSASATALEAGHTEQMLFNHYRELVTPGVAEQFWSIHP